MSRSYGQKLGVGALLGSLVVMASSAASAEVKREGQWPATDPKISLDVVSVSKGEALKKLADAAGWSIVATEMTESPTTIHVKDQPAGKVLDLLLGEGHYVAKRDGTLISITGTHDVELTLPAIPPIPPIAGVPPTPPTPPVAGHDRHHDHDVDDDDDDDDDSNDTSRGKDRTITGGNVRVEKNEVVHDITVMGGNVEVLGTVTGDVVVMGGTIHLFKEARVKGDAEAVGGKLILDDGSRVDGDVGVVGGVLSKSPGAKVGGDIDDDENDSTRAEEEKRRIEEQIQREREAAERAVERGSQHDKERAQRDKERAERERVRAEQRARDARPESRGHHLLREAGDAITRTALLFVFGTVLLALGTARMERLKIEIASKPMRTFATGIMGVICGIAVLIALCITIVGIPFALIGLLFAFVATVVGVVSVLETLGSALIHHKTKNPYVHLAFGCLVFLVLGAIPYVGGFVVAVVMFTAMGSMVATRCAGLIPSKKAPESGSPYRDVPSAAS